MVEAVVRGGGVDSKYITRVLIAYQQKSKWRRKYGNHFCARLLNQL